MVVRLLAKEKVVGSNPIARSVLLWRRGQVVRQGSAKPLFRGSNPLDASNKTNLLTPRGVFFYSSEISKTNLRYIMELPVIYILGVFCACVRASQVDENPVC